MKHGQAKAGQATVEYQAWQNMLSRCRNQNAKWFKNYGGRGISVCEKWKGTHGFEAFFADLGCRPSSDYTLERIDNERGYEPGNCRWATRFEQAANKRRMERHGRAKLTRAQVDAIRSDRRSQTAIAIEYGISQGHVSHIRNGRFWRVEDGDPQRVRSRAP